MVGTDTDGVETRGRPPIHSDGVRARPELVRLTEEGTIRPISVRGLFFLVALGAASPYTLTGLSTHFDELDGPLDSADHVREVTDIIIGGLRLPYG
jgi:hypothetical protein